jgi:uncharacterized protein (UPF0335 family)
MTNTTTLSDKELSVLLNSYISKILEINQQKRDLSQEINELYKEAEEKGIDKKILRKVISLKKKQKHEIETELLLTERYVDALDSAEQVKEIHFAPIVLTTQMEKKFLIKIKELQNKCEEACFNEEKKQELLKQGIPDTFLDGINGIMNFNQFIFKCYSGTLENMKTVLQSISNDYEGEMPELNKTSRKILNNYIYKHGSEFNDKLSLIELLLNMTSESLKTQMEGII